jgi:hypothetical protein
MFMQAKPVSPRRRRRLAKGLRNLVQAADTPFHGLSAAVPIERGQIIAERDLLLQLADELESDDELEARGIARLDSLLTDAESPAYAPSPPGSLHAALIHAHAALYLD